MKSQRLFPSSIRAGMRWRGCATVKHIGAVFAFLAALALAACAPFPTGSGRAPANAPAGWIGHITSIEGQAAFVDLGNTGAARPAQVGQTVLPGDRFFTGDGTRMKIEFASGGYMELDENTDPSLFEDLGCLVISLFRAGRIFVDKAAACVESLDTKSQQFSKVAYEVMGGGQFLQITVVEGEARTLRPEIARAPTGWRIDVNRRQVMAGGAYQVSAEEIRNTISWTRYYRDLQRRPYRPPFGAPADRWPLPGLPFPPRRDPPRADPPRGDPPSPPGKPGGIDRPTFPPPRVLEPPKPDPDRIIVK